jgi:hypothetical protein
MFGSHREISGSEKEERQIATIAFAGKENRYFAVEAWRGKV